MDFCGGGNEAADAKGRLKPTGEQSGRNASQRCGAEAMRDQSRDPDVPVRVGPVSREVKVRSHPIRCDLTGTGLGPRLFKA
jgi:hypothetical protein